MRSVIFTVLAVIFMPTVTHAGCACPIIPNEGSYAMADGAVSLSYMDGNEEDCPSVLRLQANATDRPPVDVILECKGGLFEGAEETPFGQFIYRLSAAGSDTAYGVGTSPNVTVKLILPADLKKIGKKDRVMQMTMGLDAKPAPCICGQVREELAFAEAMLKAYENKSILKQAETKHLRGKKHSAGSYLDSSGTLQRFSKPSLMRKAYEDLVDAQGEQNYSGQPSTSTMTNAQIAAKQGIGGANSVAAGASASTNPITCKVNMPTAKAAAKACTPSIVLQAWQAHEDAHADLCKKINAMKIKAWDDKTPMSLGNPLATFQGYSLPISNYAAYSQWPPHQSADEATAYKEEIAVYKPWLKAHCEK